MIVKFKCKETKRLFDDIYVKKFKTIERQARSKLEMLNAAVSINSLTIPPGNKLEKLKGKRADHYSIRINDQWRICFLWENENAYEVEIVDYHK